MLSLKLPRLLSMEQVPQVCALIPMVEFQAATRAGPLQHADCYVSTQSSLCRPSLYKEALTDSLGESRLPVSLICTEPENGSDPETVLEL